VLEIRGRDVRGDESRGLLGRYLLVEVRENGKVREIRGGERKVSRIIRERG